MDKRVKRAIADVNKRLERVQADIEADRVNSALDRTRPLMDAVKELRRELHMYRRANEKREYILVGCTIGSVESQEMTEKEAYEVNEGFREKGELKRFIPL
jgi:hypothetical protein